MACPVRWCRKYGGNLSLSILAGICCFPLFLSVLMAEENPNSYNNFGGVGLLDMRTARFAPDGTIAVGLHHDSQGTRYFSTWQATPWLETTLSYRDDKMYVDRSLDLKIRLWTESNYRPQLAIGIQDALGAGRFGAEYLVASKRYYDFDFTMGFAWGYLGSRGGVGNMFRLFSDSFDQRSMATSSGGIRTGSFFSGNDMSFFAGVEYFAPIKGLSFKIEYSGVDTAKIPEFSHLKKKSAFNFGVNYKPLPWADVAAGFDQGNRFSIRLTLKQNLHKFKSRKLLRKPERVPITERRKSEVTRKSATNHRNDSAAEFKTAESAFKKMTVAKLKPVSILVEERKVTVRKQAGPYFAEVKNIGQTARILTGEMAENIEEFVIITEKDGAGISQVSLLRQDLEKAASYRSSPEEIWSNSVISVPPTDQPIDQPTDKGIYQPQSGPRFDIGLKPNFVTHFGGDSDGRFRADFNVKLFGSVHLARKLKLSAELQQYIMGDIDKLPLDMRPGVPKVRSDIARYAGEGRTAITRMQLDYTAQIGSDIYARLTGGLMESMFGGIGAEILYRPYERNFAFGVDMNWVRQRDYNQLFSFRGYDVFTGHATLYYENTNYDITSKLSAGRYLAGDYGATFDISRHFSNGIRIGVWATFTNMSSEDFGDGSFDKGIYLTMPLEIFWYQPTREKMRYNFQGLGKNGGQKLDWGSGLYDMLSPGRMDRIARNWHELLD